MNLAVDFLGISIDLQGWLNLAITISASFTLYRLEQKRREAKTLDYAVNGMENLISRPNLDIRTHMKVTLTDEPDVDKEEQPMKELRIINYRIANTGKRAIQADDFRKPIEVSVAKGSIVAVVVTGVSHTGILELGPVPGESLRSRVFTPVLLNKKDWIDIKVITNGCLDLPKIDSWIFEQSRDMQRRRSSFDPFRRKSFKKQSLRETFTPKPPRQKSPQWYEIIIVIFVLLWILGQIAQDN